jgi:peptide/nickel transport system substrate-binding protein
MRRFIAAILVILVISGMLAVGCSTTASPTATQPTATQPTATQPTATQPTATQPTATQPTATQPTATQPTTTAAVKPTGTVTVGIENFGNGSFIAWKSGFPDAGLYLCLYDTLGIPDSKGHAIPSVAQSWEYSSDYLTLTFHLRKGIQFHEGYGELTSADVKYTFEQTMSADSIMGNKNKFTDPKNGIASMDTPDPYTFVIHFRGVNTDLISNMTEQNEDTPIVCKKYVEKVGVDEASRHPIGSGPYHFVEFKSGDYAKFEAVENNWRVVPQFQTIILKLVPEESTRVAMLRTGLIDVCIISPINKLNLENAGLKVESIGYGGANELAVFGGTILPEDTRKKAGYHNTDPWNSDPVKGLKVRQAMNISIDRDAINKTFELGTAKPLSVGHLEPGWDEQPLYPFDQAKAKQLLTEAGYPNGFSFDLINSPFHPGVPMIAKEYEAVAGYWEQVGIHATLKPIDFMAFYPTMLAWDTKGLLFTYRLLYQADNYNIIYSFLPDSAAAPPIDCTPESRDLVKKILAEPNLAARDPLYKQLMKLDHDNYTTVPLLVINPLIAYNPEKVGSWLRSSSSYYLNEEYIPHATPLNTFKLFPYK